MMDNLSPRPLSPSPRFYDDSQRMRSGKMKWWALGVITFCGPFWSALSCGHVLGEINSKALQHRLHRQSKSLIDIGCLLLWWAKQYDLTYNETIIKPPDYVQTHTRRLYAGEVACCKLIYKQWLNVSSSSP